MNARAFGIVVSLLVNAVLVYAVVHRSSPSPFGDAMPGPAVATAAAKSAPAEIEVITPETWRTLSSGSLSEVVARLKAGEFSPRLQRLIMAALVEQQFADRHRALADLIRARPWWKGIIDSKEGAKLIAARQKLQRDETDVVDALLGPDLGSTPYITASRLYRYGNLPPATLAQLDRINGDYGELMGEIKNANRGLMLPADREQLLFLARQNHADVAQLLTPEQLFEYDMRSSPEGWWLRTITASMNPSEDEFRALFKVRSASIAPYSDGQYELMTAEDKAAIERLGPQVEEQIRGVLTPERFAEYQLKTTPEYRATEALVHRLALPDAATATLVTVQKEIAKRAEVIRANASLTPVTRNAQLGALADEAVARLTPTLGDSGLSAYRQSAGRWINALQPAPTPPTPTNPKG
jgi:hypothetical protein